MIHIKCFTAFNVDKFSVYFFSLCIHGIAEYKLASWLCIKCYISLQVLDNHQAKLDREVLLHGNNLSQEEYKKLVDKYAQEQEAIRRNMQAEKDKQKLAIQQKVSYHITINNFQI